MENKYHTITCEMLMDLDALYEDKEDISSPTVTHRHWGLLVEKLRQIRRLVEAGVMIRIEGSETVLTTWQDFYSWAHGRYHKLEEGYDEWIGHDD
jgi:hypothetical protein